MGIASLFVAWRPYKEQIMSWASIASRQQHEPQRANQHKHCYEKDVELARKLYQKRTLAQVMVHAMGAPIFDDAMPPLIKLWLEHLVIVSIDTESWTCNTDELTEIGIAVLTRRECMEEANDYSKEGIHAFKPGEHGQNILDLMQFFHMRILHTAHLKSNNALTRGPEGNRFGHSRFVTYSESHALLDSFMNQEIHGVPDLEGWKRPVVLVGHALEHDERNVKRLGYDFEKFNTIVAKVDTQALTKQVGAWEPTPKGSSNQISLANLCEQVLKFPHVDPHTACNDAARTLICAVWLSLPFWDRQNPEHKMQGIIERVEARSKSKSHRNWGSIEHCIKCGGRDHSELKCTVPVVCFACAVWQPKLPLHEHTHIEQHCPHVAEFRAWLRRFNDARRKQKRPEDYPPDLKKGAHPWSTFTDEFSLENGVNKTGLSVPALHPPCPTLEVGTALANATVTAPLPAVMALCGGISESRSGSRGGGGRGRAGGCEPRGGGSGPSGVGKKQRGRNNSSRSGKVDGPRKRHGRRR